MPLFRRSPAPPPDPRSAVADFWAWWAGARQAMSAAIASGGLTDGLVRDLSGRVAAIDQRLDWEMSPGRSAQHALVLSAAGDLVVRPMAERWVRSAPAGDPEWEYYPARQPDQSFDSVLELGGHRVRLRDTQFGIGITDWAAVDLTVWHPAFPDADDTSRARSTYLLLDWLLGEDMVETWVGRIEIAPPEDPRSAQEVRQLITERRDRWPADNWVLLQRPDGGMLIRRLDPLPWLTGLLCDVHLEVQVDRRQAGSERVEEELLAVLAGDGLLLAVLTESAAQTMHLQVLDLPSLRERVNHWATRAPGSPRCTWQPDPAWAAVRALP